MKIQIKRPLMVFAAGLVLVAASSVGATRAAMAYQSDANSVDFSTSTLTVDLQEKRGDKFESIVADGTLEFTSLQKENDEKKMVYDFNIGQTYPEEVKVINNSPGKYDEYVRISLKKSWTSLGCKDTDLNPDTIVLGLEKDWIISDKSEEGAVYYYTKPLKYEGEADFLDSITIDNKIWEQVKTVPVKGEDNIIVNEYRYNNESITVELRVDAIQAHNGAEAMLGAWGVDAKFDGDTLISVDGSTEKTN